MSKIDMQISNIVPDGQLTFLKSWYSNSVHIRGDLTMKFERDEKGLRIFPTWLAVVLAILGFIAAFALLWPLKS